MCKGDWIVGFDRFFFPPAMSLSSPPTELLCVFRRCSMVYFRQLAVFYHSHVKGKRRIQDLKV